MLDVSLVQSQQWYRLKQKQMNELIYGEKINPPISIVRSVSFEKIRQGSLSSQSSKILQISKMKQPFQPTGLCQRLISNKLLGNSSQIASNALQNKSIDTNQSHKASIIKKQLEQKEMKQCTFKPKVNKNNHPQRTLQQFIDHQIAYEKHKEDKVNELRQMIRVKMDKQNTFQPIIIKNGNDQYLRKPLGPVHQRLYEQSSKRSQSKQSIQQSLEKGANPSFAPKVKIATYSRKGSQKSIGKSCTGSKQSTLLHHDPQQFNSSVPQSSKQTIQAKVDSQSLSRKEYSQSHSNRSHSHQKGLKITKYMDVQELCDKKLNNKKMLEERQTKKVSAKNKEIYIKKVLRQINCILTQMNIHEVDLSYIQMSQILEKMNFIDEQTNINDRKYLFEIWQMLQGDLYESCPLTNLIKIIFCLLGCHDFNIIEECLALAIEEKPSNKKLVLTEKQSKTIKSNFQQLALNRLKKGEYTANEPKTKQFPFKPFVSKNSVQMAQKYRQKVLQQSERLISDNLIQFEVGESGQVGHVQLLLLDDKRKELKMRLKRQEQERERKRLEDESMQGDKQKKDKPKLFQTSENVTQRFQHLYELGKQNIRNKNQKILQLKEMPKQCTFHPNLGRSKQNLYNRLTTKQSKQNSLYNSINQLLSKPVEEIKDFDKSIFRLREGRKYCDQIYSNHSKQEGTEKSSLLVHQHGGDDSPLLYLNVNLSGYDDVKIPVYQNDNMKTITKKVKTMSGISYGQDRKLQEFLRHQIMPTLKQVGMNLDKQ